MSKSKKGMSTSGGQQKITFHGTLKKATSIGDGVHCVPKNKYKRRNWKRYIGQGK